MTFLIITLLLGIPLLILAAYTVFVLLSNEPEEQPTKPPFEDEFYIP